MESQPNNHQIHWNTITGIYHHSPLVFILISPRKVCKIKTLQVFQVAQSTWTCHWQCYIIWLHAVDLGRIFCLEGVYDTRHNGQCRCLSGKFGWVWPWCDIIGVKFSLARAIHPRDLLGGLGSHKEAAIKGNTVILRSFWLLW